MFDMYRLTDWLFFLLGVGCIATLGVQFHRSKSAGPVLLDIRGHDSSRFRFGILALVMGWSWVFVHRLRFQGFYWMAYGMVLIAAARRARFQIRGSGILTRRLFRWEDIQEYYLSPKGSLGINLRGKGWTGIGEVPREDFQQLNELLSARLPAQQVIQGF